MHTHKVECDGAVVVGERVARLGVDADAHDDDAIVARDRGDHARVNGAHGLLTYKT